jgi:hypothetical protein
VLVTAGARLGSVSEAFTYSWPLSLTGGDQAGGGAALPANVPSKAALNATAHSRLVTLAGSGMGLSDATLDARVQATATESTRWVSDTCVVVRVASGIWDMHALAATVGVLKGTGTKAFSFDGRWPYVFGLRQGGMIPPPGYTVGSSGDLWRGSAGVCAGGVCDGCGECTRRNTEVVGYRLAGDNIVNASVGVRVGGSACEASIWLSDSTVWCRAARGLGMALPLVTDRYRPLVIVTRVSDRY